MDDTDLKQLARRRVKVKREFLTHLLIYLATNAMLVGIWAVTGHGYPWFLWVLAGWGIGVVANAIVVVMELYAPEDRAVDRELRRLRH